MTDHVPSAFFLASNVALSAHVSLAWTALLVISIAFYSVSSDDGTTGDGNGPSATFCERQPVATNASITITSDLYIVFSFHPNIAVRPQCNGIIHFGTH